MAFIGLIIAADKLDAKAKEGAQHGEATKMKREKMDAWREASDER